MFNKIDYFFRRAAAYSVDILLITIVVNSLVSSDKVNFQLDKYNKNYEEYKVVYYSYYEHSVNSDMQSCDDFKNAIDTYKLTEEKYVDEYEKISKSLEAEEITEEEYEEKCSLLINKYHDSTLSDEEFSEKENYYIYNLEYNYIVAYIINLVICLLYFVLFQGFTYGQTLGKKIFRLKVVSDNGDKVSYKQLFLRSIFLFSIIYYVLAIISVFLISVDNFSFVYTTLLSLNSLLSFVMIISILTTKDYKGFHGMISKTKVILVDFKGNEIDLVTNKKSDELEENKIHEKVEVSKNDVKKIKKNNLKKTSKSKSKK